MGIDRVSKADTFEDYYNTDDSRDNADAGYILNMDIDLLNIQMTSQEYEFYRNCQKEIDKVKKLEKQHEEIVASLRDQYVKEFNERQTWAKRAIIAEKKLDKLLDIVHSAMPAKLRLETLSFEIEEVYKERDYKHD